MDTSTSMDWSALAGSALTAASSALGGISDYKDAKKLLEMQHNWAIEDWNRTNEYNLPVNQVKRLQDAGLNANLVFGGNNPNIGASSVSEPSSVPKTSRWRDAMAGMMSFMQNLLSIKQQKASIENTKASTQYIYKQALTESERAANIKSQTSLNQWQNDFNVRNQSLLDEQLRSTNERLRRDIDKVVADTNHTVADTLRVNTTVRQINATIEEINARIDKIRGEIDLNEAQIKNIGSMIQQRAVQNALYEAQKNNYESQKDVNDAIARYKNREFDKLDQAIARGEIDNWLAGMQADMYYWTGSTTPGNRGKSVSYGNSLFGSYSAHDFGNYNYGDWHESKGSTPR